jgi:hypothetical protein
MSHHALYTGTVMHRRLRPKRHVLHYRVFQWLIDLDHVDTLNTQCQLIGHNRWNLFGFYDRDFADGADTPLKPRIVDLLTRAGHALAWGQITLLTMPRILGYAFNPLSLYFCHDTNRVLRVMVYEVSNTFHQRHTYVIPVEPPGRTPIRQSCDKAFYVSPFLDMDMTYQFRVTPPGPDVAIHIQCQQDGKAMLNAAFSGHRAPLTDRTLIRALFTHPLLTLKVIVGIHWEAVQIWLKGVGFRHRPAPPASPFTSVKP